jgi:hypothetical protein
MRKSTLMALALASTTLVATPAAATIDNAGYAGIEAGLWFPNDTSLDFDFGSLVVSPYDYDIEYKMGFDGDLIGGYDFGQFRAELELGYKTADLDKVSVDFGNGSLTLCRRYLGIWSLMVTACGTGVARLERPSEAESAMPGQLTLAAPARHRSVRTTTSLG